MFLHCALQTLTVVRAMQFTSIKSCARIVFSLFFTDEVLLLSTFLFQSCYD